MYVEEVCDGKATGERPSPSKPAVPENLPPFLSPQPITMFSNTSEGVMVSVSVARNPYDSIKACIGNAILFRFCMKGKHTLEIEYTSQSKYLKPRRNL